MRKGRAAHSEEHSRSEQAGDGERRIMQLREHIGAATLRIRL
ncbi:MAG: hypothetical protein OIN88_07560 [Candidatus Methanoperedens sp.]|nr:hypothetical protein [Candidatus Methanoperedens sp.]MCZ7361050.1 hypothetical protein [Candidatus Methanoperedens sp.]